MIYMSVVIGFKQKDKVWLACDKQVTTGERKAFLANHHKIIAVPERDGVIIGSVGVLRGINLLETNNNYIDELTYYKEGIDYNYMVNAFPILVNDLYVAHGMIGEDEQTLNLRNEFLVATDTHLFEVGWDGSVMESQMFAAIGSGAELAFGVLSSYPVKEYSDKEVVDILRQAILAASYNVGCGGGGVMMNTAENKVYEFSFK